MHDEPKRKLKTIDGKAAGHDREFSQKESETLIGHVFDDRWKLVERLGKGSYGAVYSCVDLTVRRRYAIKVENRPPERRSAVIGIELQLFSALNKSNAMHVPQLFGHGSCAPYNYIVISLLGQSLSHYRHASRAKRFSLATTLRAALQMVECLREVHDTGYVHRDVKPGNFVTGRKKLHNISIIDFGIAQRYLSSTGVPLQARTEVGFRGTTRYASIHAHQHQELSPRDDYWSLLFALVEMLTGKLPWDTCKDKAAVQSCKYYAITNGTLTAGLPTSFHYLLAYLNALTYHDLVDHRYVTTLFKLDLAAHGLPLDGPADWELAGPPRHYIPTETGPEITPPNPVRYRNGGQMSAAAAKTGSERISAFTYVSGSSDATNTSPGSPRTPGGSRGRENGRGMNSGMLRGVWSVKKLAERGLSLMSDLII